MAEDSNVIRLSLALRASAVFFFCIWCGGVSTIGIVAAADGSLLVTVIALVMLALGLTFGYRLTGISLNLSPEEILVRNFLRTRRVSRADIEAIRVGSIGDWPFRGNVYLALRDGSDLPLDVAGRRIPIGSRGQARVEERRRRLESWLVDQ